MPFATSPHTSALSSFIQSQPARSAHTTLHHNLALQIQYNLQYQHDWTNLHIHTVSPLSKKHLPRPLISGLPPHRIYVHPDDQVEELARGLKDEDTEVEREWVLPTNLREKWSLRNFAEIFDAIGEEPPNAEDDKNNNGQNTDNDMMERSNSKKRRGGKRLLLATLGDDSTVVYYIVHDGIVKPRQN